MLIFSVTVILTIVSYVCLDPILTLMQIPADIYGLMRSYMGLILAGLIFVFSIIILRFCSVHREIR